MSSRRVVRQVEDSDVEAACTPVVHHPIDGGDHLRDINGTAVIGNLDADDASIRSNSNEVGRACAAWVGSGSTAGDDADDVGAVPVSVEAGNCWIATLERKVRTDDHVGGGQFSDPCNSRVDHCDVHTSTRVTGSPHCAGADLVDNLSEARLVGG